MEKIVFVLVFVTLISGCAFVPKKTEKFIIDSDHAKYEQRKAELESAYLNGEITYSEY